MTRTAEVSHRRCFASDSDVDEFIELEFNLIDAFVTRAGCCMPLSRSIADAAHFHASSDYTTRIWLSERCQTRRKREMLGEINAIRFVNRPTGNITSLR